MKCLWFKPQPTLLHMPQNKLIYKIFYIINERNNGERNKTIFLIFILLTNMAINSKITERT